MLHAGGVRQHDAADWTAERHMAALSGLLQ